MKNFFYISILLFILFTLITVSISVGSVKIDVYELINMFMSLFSGTKGNFSEGHWNIVFLIRLPRILLACLVGAALAISGATFQGFLRNPLADPYIVGVSAGAAAGAGCSFLFKLDRFFISPTPLCAFMGAVFTVFLVYRLSLVRGKIPVDTFLLAGVIVGSFFWALVSFIMFLANEDLHKLIFWMMGSLSEKEWSHILLILPYLAAGTFIIWVNSRSLNIMTLGDESAHYLGLNVERTKLILICAASLITASAVSVSGIIGFVGLIVPHMVRMIFGPDNRLLIPVSAITGAVLLVFSDTIARTILSPVELPVGIITALLGAPFFCYLLRKRKFSFF
ncbi:MAG: iron chelate uptake ABC transporter family permease subunit [Candidatus Eremiobacterota bacterium]